MYKKFCIFSFFPKKMMSYDLRKYFNRGIHKFQSEYFYCKRKTEQLKG